ncbi:hypothetical protein FB45DRAFT_997703 [Roridomyces roridus]|uniref:6-methylsalicylate decarboxylase n=1 Tax=Roridomyces roridus TaxID=1738132 RepID=A0AAD7FZ57_9AGAR|nr:hypothetical protein FB45DRAFT_997703 [Roridomyces roridus]
MDSYKIDVHAHFLTPSYLDALKKAGHVPGPDNLPFTPDWSPETHLAFMEKNNIAKSFLSITGPGTHLIPGDDAFAREVTREVNEFAAAVKRRYPAKFGFFASLPLPDIEGALAEIDYVLDELNADGFVLMTNFHGMYFGDARLAAVYAKLQARKATVFVHPMTPCGPTHEHTAELTPQRKRDVLPLGDTFIVGMMEYFFDTTRTIIDLLLSGTASAHPDIKFIIPHCGNALPSVLDRALLLSASHLRHFNAPPVRGPLIELTPADVRELFSRQFYFDLAGTPMASLIHHMLSDVPFNSWAAAEGQARDIEEGLSELFREEEKEGIYHGNAERLFGEK